MIDRLERWASQSPLARLFLIVALLCYVIPWFLVMVIAMGQKSGAFDR